MTFTLIFPNVKALLKGYYSSPVLQKQKLKLKEREALKIIILFLQ